MTIALALEYIPRRMKDLGFGSDYYLRFKHLVLQPHQTLELDACNQFFLLIEEAKDVNISSDFGLFDLSDNKTNEQCYEHQGNIRISNYAPGVNHVRFIQIIPKNH